MRRNSVATNKFRRNIKPIHQRDMLRGSMKLLIVVMNGGKQCMQCLDP